MKSLSLAFIAAFLLTISLFSQDKKHFYAIPATIIGEWKLIEPKEHSKFQSITFYPGGLLNIDTKGSKLVVNYSVSYFSRGYLVSISGMADAPPFSSFLIKSIRENKMQITASNGKSGRIFTFIKDKDIPSGIIPLQAK